MQLKYLALGILVGYLAPYALTLIKAKKDNSTAPEETIFNYENDD
jgi:hypothetical protein